MKPPDEIRRELVERWLKKAEEDFGVAELLIAERAPYLSAAGFHLQECSIGKNLWSPTPPSLG